MNYLPLEIHYKILTFVNIKISYLYNCSLINRTWCLLCIPLLWKNPFNNNKIMLKIIPQITNDDNFDNFYSIIKICVNFLDDDTKTHFNITNTRRPLFEYYKYMNELNFSELHLAVSNWVVKQFMLSRNDNVISKHEFDLLNKKSCHLSHAL